MSEPIKKTFGRNAVYDVPRNVAFTIKITEDLERQIKEETQKRVELSPEITDPRLQFKSAQLGFEIINQYFVNKSIDTPNVEIANNALKDAYQKLKIKYSELLTYSKSLIETTELQQVIEENQRLTAELETAQNDVKSLSYTSENGKYLLQIQNKVLENETLTSEVNRLKKQLNEIGTAISNVSGYYYSRAFSELKSKIISIITSI